MSNVLKVMDSDCSGRQHCLFYVADYNGRLGIRPCSKEFASYMVASYDCLSGEYLEIYIIEL